MSTSNCKNNIVNRKKIVVLLSIQISMISDIFHFLQVSVLKFINVSPRIVLYFITHNIETSYFFPCLNLASCIMHILNYQMALKSENLKFWTFLLGEIFVGYYVYYIIISQYLKFIYISFRLK